MSVVTPSQWLKGLVSKSFLNDYPVTVISNGIDVTVFKPKQGNFRLRYGLDGKYIVLGVASAWDERKGFNDFISLAKVLDDRYRIVLVGLTDKQIDGLPENVIGITKTNNVQELAEIYTAADVLFNPTYEDNYPTVNLEAQSCGTPVITYATGGSVESVPPENAVAKGDFQSARGLFGKDLAINGVQRTQDFGNDYLSLYYSVLK